MEQNMSEQAKRLERWFNCWDATKTMLDGAQPEELSPESQELVAALLALAED
jgi:hypothetical protein